MLSQRSIQLWEGYSARGVPFRENHEDTKRASCCSAPLREWKSLYLQRRKRLRVSTGRQKIDRSVSAVVVCSQGIQSAPVEPLRSSEGGANSLRLDGENVRIASLSATSDARPANDGHEGLDCGETATAAAISNAAPSSAIASRRVSLRSPGPLPEGSRLDSEAADLEDTKSDLDRSSASAAHDVEPTGVADDVIVEPDVPKNSFERFARARAVGRELAKRNPEGGGGLGSAIEEEDYYYTPMIGDYVMGIVASGTFSKLDIDIGAKELGHLFRKDAMPLDLCNPREMSCEMTFAPSHGIRFVHDEEVLNLAPQAPMVVELGTVLAMQVKGMTPSGRALLSARSVAREYAWQRVRQLIEHNATLEVQITKWTTAGLISKIEGLRAFLPTYYLVNHVPEPSIPVSGSYKEYVGQKFTVMISSVDETRSNLVISEKKAWMAKNAYIGALVEGIVTEIQPYGVHLRIKNTYISGVLHISNISRARVNNIASVFSIGEEVKAMVVPSNTKNRLAFSTADLEIADGLILRDKEAVFQGAERVAAEIAKAYENKQSESVVDNNDNLEVVNQDMVIANWDWLDFGDQNELD